MLLQAAQRYPFHFLHGLISTIMRTVFNALVRELGYEEGTSIFEWYCRTYKVTISDDAPATVKREVFGV